VNFQVTPTNILSHLDVEIMKFIVNRTNRGNNKNNNGKNSSHSSSNSSPVLQINSTFLATLQENITI